MFGGGGNGDAPFLPPHPLLYPRHHPTCLLYLSSTEASSPSFPISIATIPPIFPPLHQSPLPILYYLPTAIPTTSSPHHTASSPSSYLFATIRCTSSPLHYNPISILSYLPAILPASSPLHYNPISILSYLPAILPASSPLHRNPLPILSSPCHHPPASSLHQILLPILSNLPATIPPTSLSPPLQPLPHPLLYLCFHPTYLLSPLPILSYLLVAIPLASLLHYNPLPILAHLPMTTLYPSFLVAAFSSPRPNRKKKKKNHYSSSSNAADNDHCVFLGLPSFPPPSSSPIVCNISSANLADGRRRSQW